VQGQASFEGFISNMMRLECSRKKIALIAVVLGLFLTACGSQPKEEEDGKLKVLATTTIVGDVVNQVGGDLIDLEVLMPIGTDPHTFTATPEDLVKIAEADLVFLNGVGLETFLDKYLANAGGEVRIVEVSEGVKVLELNQTHEHEGGDPHTWTDPGNVKVWVENIAAALGELDPENADNYRLNAEAYQLKLNGLDSWIENQVVEIPPERRKIVSDHESLAYFAQRYGFIQIGTVIPGTSTLAEPSAQEIAELEDLIRLENIQAIFVDKATNPMLTERISTDTGAKIVQIYSGSLTDASGEAGSYLDYMQYNVNAIIEALK
jgi:manganese/iron transport system substrate-binding protein